MLVFVAQSGKSFEVVVDKDTRVSAIASTLAQVTGITPSDQVLMFEGTRLDPGKPLLAYGLPAAAGTGVRDVFLYNKSHLRFQGQAALELAKPLVVEEPAQPAQQPHVLDSASSPLVRTLPQYERQFLWHLQLARAGCQALKQRHEDCLALVSEMEVQGRAIEVARTSVEVHYTYIHTQMLSFSQRYTQQHKAHTEFLAGFEQSLQSLEAADLHPACGPEYTKLAHLVEPPRLRAWAGSCQACHQSLAQKVAGVEELFGGLKADVEAVFMQAPTVQLEALATQLQAMQPHLQELESMREVLERDDSHIRRLVGAAGQELGRGGAGDRVTALDTCELMETMHENHTAHLVPQIAHYRALFEHFYNRCLEDKNQMTRDVTAQLQRISSQQMKIQSIRNKLAVFREAAAKKDDMFAQLLLVRRIPAAYRQCLAECVRRRAFGELYGSQALQMAERMGKLREKEIGVRDAFLGQVAVYIPPSVLAGLGLVHQPPHCQISLPSHPTVPDVTLADLKRGPTSGSDSTATTPLVPFESSPSGPALQSPAHATASSCQQQATVDEEDKAAGLEIENARLRAELATRIAEECMHSLSEPPGHRISGALPDVGSAEEAPGTSAPRSGPSEGPQALLTDKLQGVIAAKQELVSQLEQQLAQTKAQAARYETRISTLEDRLSSHASLMSSESAQPGSQQEPRAASDAGSTAPKPVPLALTPVLTSPTRSVSPAAQVPLHPTLLPSNELPPASDDSSGADPRREAGESDPQHSSDEEPGPSVADRDVAPEPSIAASDNGGSAQQGASSGEAATGGATAVAVRFLIPEGSERVAVVLHATHERIAAQEF